jgi:sulfite reductase (NADPH) flavoprotein alpha-component
MIGPGTGIAPFRAFLHDRRATGAPGKNWLFFGHQRSDCDFFYADELNAMKTSGLLTRMSLAWSRDGDKKFYVQDRMREVGRELWTWLAEGANVYICGDAKRMAKDVERALVRVPPTRRCCLLLTSKRRASSSRTSIDGFQFAVNLNE